MIPFLLPVALAIFAVGGVVILLLVVGYHVVRRDSALVVVKKGGEPRVLLKGAVFAFPGFTSTQTIDLTPRDYRRRREIVTDRGREQVDIALELGVRGADDAVLQIREMLGDKASDAAALERFAFDRVDAAVAAAAVAGISFDEFAAEAEASIKSSLPAFSVEALSIARIA
jgi:uncharacterized membrane protein YqiK